MVKLLNFKCHSDKRGNLIAIEGNKDVPFEIKRTYYIFGNKKKALRGCHAHRKLEEVIICLSGHCDIYIGRKKTVEEFHLCNPNEGIYIGPMRWIEFTNFSKNCILLVLASDHYDKSDYINSYKAYLKEMEND